MRNISSNSVILNWQNPLDNGEPCFSMFMVELASSLVVFSGNNSQRFNTVDNSSFTVTALESNTNYTVRVRAVSTPTLLGDLSGPFSNRVTFKTMLECKSHLLYKPK